MGLGLPDDGSARGGGSHTPRHSELMLRDYRLTTAEILYHMPDHPDLLQTYIWQELDLAPRFPVLRRFLEFWRSSLDGRLHSVRVAAGGSLIPGNWRAPGAILQVH